MLHILRIPPHLWRKIVFLKMTDEAFIDDNVLPGKRFILGRRVNYFANKFINGHLDWKKVFSHDEIISVVIIKAVVYNDMLEFLITNLSFG